MNDTLVFDFVTREVVLVTSEGERRPAADEIALVGVPTPSLPDSRDDR